MVVENQTSLVPYQGWKHGKDVDLLDAVFETVEQEICGVGMNNSSSSHEPKRKDLLDAVFEPVEAKCCDIPNGANRANLQSPPRIRYPHANFDFSTNHKNFDHYAKKTKINNATMMEYEMSSFSLSYVSYEEEESWDGEEFSALSVIEEDSMEQLYDHLGTMGSGTTKSVNEAVDQLSNCTLPSQENTPVGTSSSSLSQVAATLSPQSSSLLKKSGKYMPSTLPKTSSTTTKTSATRPSSQTGNLPSTTDRNETLAVSDNLAGGTTGTKHADATIAKTATAVNVTTASSSHTRRITPPPRKDLLDTIFESVEANLFCGSTATVRPLLLKDSIHDDSKLKQKLESNLVAGSALIHDLERQGQQEGQRQVQKQEQAEQEADKHEQSGTNTVRDERERRPSHHHGIESGDSFMSWEEDSGHNQVHSGGTKQQHRSRPTISRRGDSDDQRGKLKKDACTAIQSRFPRTTTRRAVGVGSVTTEDVRYKEKQSKTRRLNASDGSSKSHEANEEYSMSTVSSLTRDHQEHSMKKHDFLDGDTSKVSDLTTTTIATEVTTITATSARLDARAVATVGGDHLDDTSSCRTEDLLNAYGGGKTAAPAACDTNAAAAAAAAAITTSSSCLFRPTMALTTTTSRQELDLEDKTTAFVNNHTDLLMLIANQAECFRCGPTQFLQWLRYQDIMTLTDLHDACSDPDFVELDMIAKGGLKGFKRRMFVKAVQAATAATATIVISTTKSS